MPGSQAPEAAQAAADDREATVGHHQHVDPIPPEALLDDFPPPMRAIADELRRIVLATFPDAVERVRPGWRLIGYDLPGVRRSVYFAYVAPEVEHVHLGFEHGWAMDDPHGMLLGAGITKQVRWVTFRPGDRIDRVRVEVLLREAAAVATMGRDERHLRGMDRGLPGEP
jgi:hypothetical protein